MKKSLAVKEKIIQATIGLIRESSGDVVEINTRAISERADVGTGMVNYHFQTKENLIEICVERIIGNVISGFDPPVPPSARTPAERVKFKSKMVFDFLAANPAVSRISILSDFKNPKTADNTIKSVLDCAAAAEGLALPEKERFLLAFALSSVMQTLFLRKDQSGELFGYDINEKEQRDNVLDFLIDTIFGGFESE